MKKQEEYPFSIVRAIVLCQRHPGAAYGVEYQ
jgi:hypothetical protein